MSRSDITQNGSVPLLLSPVLPEDRPGTFDDEAALDDAVDRFVAMYRVWHKQSEKKFDVFLCHNSEDKAEVRVLATGLAQEHRPIGRRRHLGGLVEHGLQAFGGGGHGLFR